MKRMFVGLPFFVALIFLFGCSVDSDFGLASRNEEISNALIESLSFPMNEDLVFEETNETSRQSIYSIALPISFFLRGDTTLAVLGEEGVIPLAGEYIGQRGIFQYFRDFHRSLQVWDIEVQQAMMDGDYLNLHIRMKGVNRTSDIEFDLEFVWALEWDGHKISNIEIYYDTWSLFEVFYSENSTSITDIQNPEGSRWDPCDPEEYISMVNEGYDAFYFSGDIPKVLSMTDPEIYWVFKGDESLTPYAGLYYGHEGLINFFMNIAPSFILQNIEFRRFVQHGNRVDVLFTETGLSTATGKSYTIDVLHSFLIENGVFTEFKTYNDSYAVAQSYLAD